MKTVAELEGINENLLIRDIQRFVRGNSRPQQIKRWILTRNDALEKEVVADYIIAYIRRFLLDEEL
jgi:hypothetical protein